MSAFTALALLPATASAAPTFTDIAFNDGAGIGYRRAASTTNAQFDAIKLLPFMSQVELNATPLFPRGAPGVAILDYDRDGDEDIFVTNGPGRPNSLYQNRRAQGGGTRFVDVGASAGVGAPEMDATGVCYGDIDNDGDDDLYVLGRMEPNRMFRNNGNGTFTDVTGASNLGAGITSHTSCSMGDINNDGLLDIAVSNTFDWARQEAIFTDLFDYNHPNQLFMNQGSNVFTDVSASSGFLNLTPALPPEVATVSWAIAMVDIDLDGDVDIMHADDQAGLPVVAFGGVNRGYLQVFRNDGFGHLTNITHSTPNPTDPLNAEPAQWMGLAYGDMDCNGTMDVFATALGSYFPPQIGAPPPPTLFNSRWFLGTGGGEFTNPHTAPPSPFGWGTGMADFDNDGDTDIVYFGAMDTGPLITADNPGIMLQNQGCNGNFAPDFTAFAQSAERNQRSEIKGVAMGDLNDDGYMDVVHVAAQVGTHLPLIHYNESFPGPHDFHAMYMPTFLSIGPNEWEWGGLSTDDGTLGVEISSGGSNRWVKVTARGSKGLTPAGKVNRSGIGAVMFFKPRNGKQVMSPVLGGSSHESQHSLTQGFGLGRQSRGTLEILWPGGARNRLYDVEAGERITFPEIPCGFNKHWSSSNTYRQCVDRALDDLRSKGAISSSQRNRLRTSALRAFHDEH